MKTYRFIGSESEYAGIPFTVYGQSVDMDQADATALILAHPPALLLPEETFLKCGFTREELEEFRATFLHDEAPPAFLKKAQAARQAMHDLRDSLANPAVKTAEEIKE